MAKFPGFIGGSYLSASVNADCQRAVNLYPEVIESGSGKHIGMMRGTPGLSLKLTLPTSPVRGTWPGGAPLTTGGRLFAAAGSKLYEVFADYSYTELGDIGDDSAHSPVQMFPNGNQLCVISAGNVYIADGVTVAQPYYTGGEGTVNTVGTDVTWVSGVKFSFGQVGQPITISGVVYTVDSYTDPTHLVLTATAGTQTGAPYISYVTEGTCDVALTAVTWRSGPLFTQDMDGMAIQLNGSPFTVDSVEDSTHLTLAGSLVYLTDTPWSISGTVVKATTGAFIDGYFIGAKPDSKEYGISAPWDGKMWDPLDYAMKEGYPDNIGRALADHKDLWLMGDSSIEIHRDTGGDALSSFPFTPAPGAFMHNGIAAVWSAVSALEGVAWIGGDTRGQPVAYYAQGYRPQRISTHAIEQVWAGYATVADAEAFAYELDGHVFWQIGFPTGDATWVYDFTASQQLGKPMWHERSSYDGSAFHRHRARCHAYVFGKHLVGDFASGKIYEMSTAYADDAGQTITCIRTFPHICEEQLRLFFSRLQLDLETGGAALTITLDWSADSGRTWSTARTLTAPNANYTYQAEFWRLGSGRDRVFRITITGATKKALINAYLDVIAGTG